VFCLSILTLARPAAGGTASFQGLGDMPGGYVQSEAHDVSADGSTVVGHSYYEGYRWTSGRGMLSLRTLPGGSSGSLVHGVSADGSFVVGHSGSAAGPEAFRWEDLNGNGIVDPDETLSNHPEFGLGDLPGGSFYSYAYGVSGDGSVVVGYSNSASDKEAFYWTETGGMVGLGALPGGTFVSEAFAVSADGSVIVGRSGYSTDEEPFRWKDLNGNGLVDPDETLDNHPEFGLGRLPGSWQPGGSQAYGVSADGSVVVGYAGTAREAFRWEDLNGNGLVDADERLDNHPEFGLGFLPSTNPGSIARDVSADGSIVVGYSDGKAVIWDETYGIRIIKDVLENDFGLDLTGWSLVYAMGVSADGSTIVGYGTNPSGDTEGWIATIPEPAEDTIYVDANATGANDGLSWADAYNYLQDALAAAKTYDEIRVAEGIYRPDASIAEPGGSGDRNATFQLVTGAAVKGGYAGYAAPDPDARDIAANETVLSGDIGTPDDNSDNSYHVVTGATVVIDGFTIAGGNDDRSYGEGGGMCNVWGNLIVTNCTFTQNFAYSGGGMYNGRYASSTITNCTFRENSADYCGGGVYSSADTSTLTNCTFTGNSAGSDGGAMYNAAGTPTLINCILWGDSAGLGSNEIYPSSGPIITYSDVEGGWPGAGNRDSDPCFVDVAGGDLRLMFGSPCIDTGNNNASNLPSTDQAGNPRVVDGNCDGSRMVDMGALEYGVFPVPYLQNWESGISGWYSKYQPYYGPDYDPILIVSDPDPAHANVQSVVRVDAATNYLSPLIKVTAGESYAVSAWINWVSGGWPFVGVARFSESGSRVGRPNYYEPETAPHLIWLIGLEGYHETEGCVPVTDIVTPVPIVDGWYWYEKAFTVPEGTAYLRLTTELFKHQTRGGDPLGYFDDIAIDVAPATEVTFQAGDLDEDGDVDFVDFALIISASATESAASKHDRASAAGVSTKSPIELLGLNVLAHNWLAGKE